MTWSFAWILKGYLSFPLQSNRFLKIYFGVVFIFLVGGMFVLTDFYYRVIWVHNKTEKKVGRVSIYTPFPMHILSNQQPLPAKSICYSWWTNIDTISSPRSIVYSTAHSCCCTFSRFWQIYSDVYPPLYYKEQLTALKKSLCSTCLLLQTPKLPAVHLYPVSLVLRFLEWHSWNQTVYRRFILASFT